MDAPPIIIRRHSEEWRSVVAYVEARIQSHRQQLEAEGIPLDKVPALRARIAELKSLIAANPEEQRP